jgi:ferredoxin
MCDGLGACIGYCPEGAISIEKREAEPYDEVKVMEQMISKGKNTIKAHLKHLKDHGETGYLQEGVGYLKQHPDKLDFELTDVLSEVDYHGNDHSPMGGHHGHRHEGGGCPGSRERVIERPADPAAAVAAADQPSELKQWPVQMHLLNPNAPYLRGSDLLLAADCVAFSMGNYHSMYLKGRSIAIACPKLDHGTDIYIEKLTAMINMAKVNTITVMMMEVPCCGGLLQMVKRAQSAASRKVPVKQLIISISGEVLMEEWV